MDNHNYSDFYDHLTVEECRRWVHVHEESIAQIAADDPAREIKLNAAAYAHRFTMWRVKGENAANKDRQIREWEDRDARQERLVAEAIPPKGIRCLRCQKEMDFTDKHLDHGPNGDRVIMFFECPNECVPRRAFYSDGGEYLPKPHTCSKCDATVTPVTKRKKKVITMTSACLRCGNVDKQTIDLTPKPKVIDEHFEEDRAKYCLNEKGLSAYLDGKRNLEQLSKTMEEIKKRELGDNFEERLRNIKRLRVTELQELLTSSLEPLGFVKIDVHDPDTANGIMVKFTALDGNKERTDTAGVKVVRDTINTCLKETNWRLIKKSLNSVLGAVNAELKGHVSDAEIRQLLIAENPNKTIGRDGDIIL